jgi:hypothetical protein
VYVDDMSYNLSAGSSTQQFFAYYKADIKETHDYYPFGWADMTGRNWTSGVGGYRYGMNGQEKDDEIFAGAMTAEFWEYDSRTGRRWNTDPISYPWQSPYATFNGNPIYYADPDGLEGDGDGNKGDGGKKGGGNSGEKITKNPDGSSSSTIKWEGGGSCTVNTPGSSESSKGSQASAFSLRIGNTTGSYGKLPTGILPLYGSQKATYYNTPYKNSSGDFAPDEPNGYGQLEGRLKGNLEWSVLVMKQKIDPTSNYKPEAPTAFEFGLGLKKKLFEKANIFLDISGTFGPTFAAPILDEDQSQSNINFSGVTFKGKKTNRYSVVGYGATAIARIDATFVKVLTIFIAGNVHHYQGIWINTSQGGQRINYLGSAEITFGVGFNFGNKR